jgi:hypothetical protein
MVHESGGYTSPPRYQIPSKKKALQTPYGWRADSEPAAVPAGREQVASIFERALAEPAYETNRAAWDELLTLLNLKLCYQPAVASVLKEGRWRTASNPRAYVATASARLALRMGLRDLIDLEFRVQKGSFSGGPPTALHSVSPPGGPDLFESASPNGGYVRTGSGAMRSIAGWDEDEHRTIPVWLQRGGEQDCVDWETVAAYSARKPRMVYPLAKTLIHRFEQHLGYPTAIATEAHGRYSREMRGVRAAWQWIDRNQARISSLFRSERPLSVRCPPNLKVNGEPKWLRDESFESDYTPLIVDDFLVVANGVTLRLDVDCIWWGEDKNLELERNDVPPGFERPPAYYADCRTLQEAMSVLRSMTQRVEATQFFHFWPD